MDVGMGAPVHDSEPLDATEDDEAPGDAEPANRSLNGS
jgi:hypothetical protein